MLDQDETRDDNLDCDLLGRRYLNDNDISERDKNRALGHTSNTLPPMMVISSGGGDRMKTDVSNLYLWNHEINTNPHSEILFTNPASAANSRQTHTLNYNDDQHHHYQVPQHSSRSLSATPYDIGTKHPITPLNEELNQLVEAKRKKTLMLLRTKEAPRASIELTSQADDPMLESQPSLSPSQSNEIDVKPLSSTSISDLNNGATNRVAQGPATEGVSRTVSPVASDYDNLSNHINQLKLEQRQQQQFVDMPACCDNTSTAAHDEAGEGNNGVDAKHDKIGDDDNVRALNDMFKRKESKTSPEDKKSATKLDADNPDNFSSWMVETHNNKDELVSPSESSQNFNTLSLVSDILGDLSQEDNSLVQQLSRDDQ